MSKSKKSSKLGDASAVDGGGFHFPVKIDFEGQGGGVKYRPAILTVTQMALDFARNFGREPTLQVFTN